MIGSTTTVLIEHLTQSRDTHGGKTDGDADQTFADVGANIARASTLGGLYRITVAGDHSAIGQAPSEWRITDALGRVFAPTRATYRPPVARLAETEHTLLFAELQGEVTLDVVGVV